MPSILIASEDDAIRVLENIVAKQIIINDDETWRITFHNWPKYEITIRGEDFDGGIPTRIMPALIDLQRKVEEAYARMVYGEVRRLSKEERQKVELIVRVRSGTTTFETDLWGVLNTIVTQAVGNMNGSQTLAAIVITGLIVASGFGIKFYLNNKFKEKELDNKLDLSAEETRRLEIMQRAIEQSNEIVRDQVEAQSKAFDSLIRRLEPTDEIMSNGAPIIDGELGRSLVRAKRQEIIESRLDGDFIILSVDSGGVRGGYKLHVRHLADEMPMTVNVPEGTLAEAQIRTLQEGEWGKRALNMKLNTRKRGDAIIEATLVEAGLA